MKNNLSDFLKIAYKHNKVKDVKEAFVEFPVEEEWHKGNVHGVVEENNVSYNVAYEIGDIVFVSQYLYSNGSNGKNHLFVIIDQDNTAVPIDNFGMIVSSNLSKLRFSSNKLLKKDIDNNLHKDSLVKTDVIYKILDEQILFKIGKVFESNIEEYKRCFIENLA